MSKDPMAQHILEYLRDENVYLYLNLFKNYLPLFKPV